MAANALGVQKVHLVFDNEAAKEGKDAGAGTQAARYVARQCAGVKGMEIEIHNPPATHPSDCLVLPTDGFGVEESVATFVPGC
jgi:hypothetical protein